jgi:formylglycine-generating enzyme required for sulfatase activity
MRLVAFTALAFTALLITAAEPSAQPDKSNYPLWDGRETVAEYAKRTGLEPTKALDLGNGVKMEFVLIPAGKFAMGSPEKEKGRDDCEQLHQVTISRPFYMGKYEVTQEQYLTVMRNNPSNSKGDKLPVDNMDRAQAMEFCQGVREKTGRSVGLPSEAQWEYACRAGTSTAHYFGDDGNDLDEYAWHGLNADGRPHPVGEKKPNPWGLYDMYGNVAELCRDWFATRLAVRENVVDPAGDYRDADYGFSEVGALVIVGAIRNGGWGAVGAERFRSASRYRGCGGRDVGFRVTMDLSSVPNLLKEPERNPGKSEADRTGF